MIVLRISDRRTAETIAAALEIAAEAAVQDWGGKPDVLDRIVLDDLDAVRADLAAALHTLPT